MWLWSVELKCVWDVGYQAQFWCACVKKERAHCSAFGSMRKALLWVDCSYGSR